MNLPGFGGIAAVVAGEGAPLLRVHSINAWASAAEMLPLQLHFSHSRPMLTPDLPGCGLSNRPDTGYSPRLMTHAGHACAAPVDTVALSLRCARLVRAAAARTADHHSLSRISPTGFSGRRSWRGAPGRTRQVPAVLRLLRGRAGGLRCFAGLPGRA